MTVALRGSHLPAAIPLALAACGCGPVGDGDRPTTQTVVTPVADGLNNPTALLVGPDGRLVVAESGAGRVVIIDESGQAEVLVDGFPTGTYTPFHVGPLSLALAADGGLIVGEGGERMGRERVSFYAADGTPGADALVPPGGADFFDVAVEPATGRLFIASTGGDRIFVAEPGASGGFLTPTDFVADTTAAPLARAAPAALAFDAEGRLLVGFADEASGAILALNTDPAAGSLLLDAVVVDTGAVLSIALRPSDGAIAYAVLDGPLRGSVRAILPDGGESTLASGLAGPTDLAYAPGDVLYASLLGATPNDNSGQVVRIDLVEINTNGTEENGDAAP